ncbi:MAG: M1 family aminopeptidase [Deltaproteobacteria bacterium]|nr:M1 family aminopeptidase [Deltaproteobacteria bacterium]
MVCALLSPARTSAQALPERPEPPVLRLQVRLLHQGREMQGTVRIELSAQDPRRLQPELLLLLLPNRFQHPDPRGPGRPLGPLPFTSFVGDLDRADPMQPDGFDHGSIQILTVQDSKGQPLSATLEDNPDLPEGFATDKGVMRVSTGAAWDGVVEVSFHTRLPRRFWEGWGDSGSWTAGWHPVPAELGAKGWNLDPDQPRGAYYELTLTTDSAARVVVGKGLMESLEENQSLHMPLETVASRSLPVITLQHPTEVRSGHGYTESVYSIFKPDQKRLGRFALDVAQDFLFFVREKYHLPAPATRIALVAVEGPGEELRTESDLVLIPEVYFRNHPVLDRVFLARLTRALAEIWFGEGVWSHRDQDSWLSRGLAGFLALEYFEHHFGWDGGIHNMGDWLQPRYREHYFEVPLRRLMRQGRDAPLMISPLRFEDVEAARLIVYNKSPLVLRSLAFVVGEETFHRALHAFFIRFRGRQATLADFKTCLEEVSGNPLDWFFQGWFEGLETVDFSVESLEQTKTATGYTAQVTVTRTPVLPMPVVVAVATRDGGRFTQVWSGGEARATLEFQVPEAVTQAMIDPEEHWLEANRKNNYSAPIFRVRPIFDWAKQREVLVMLQALMGGNAFDGNYMGLGVKMNLDENNSLYLLPIYGQLTGLVNYEASWTIEQFLHTRLSGKLELSKLGGISRKSAQILNSPIIAGDRDLEVSAGLAREQFEAAIFSSNRKIHIQPVSEASSLLFSTTYTHQPMGANGTRLNLDIARATPRLGGTYRFSYAKGEWGEDYILHSNHSFATKISGGTSREYLPLQKRFFLGGPEMLRGYPRDPSLAYESFAGFSVDYRYVLSRRILGSGYQTRRYTAILGLDAALGRDWGRHWSDTPLRRNMVLGLEVMVNVLSIVEFPIRLELSRPIGDSDYDQTRVILFGVLSF